MTGLAIIVATPDPVRFRTALTLAAAHAALGGRTRLLLDGEAVRLAATSGAELLDSCFDLGATVTLCQGGLAAAGLDATALDARFDYGGMVGLLADLGQDRLVVV
ncbi:peroxiredoxin [Sphingomonas crusticola]|uniref:peroxiredoxin n=1 Tax=Sphingomonas crusticola TaxID=1697973 RepID=UPI000E25226B|nr:peroxiredoxin [Sphingomonas crusticola]